jgi:hypothetical protein
MASLPQPRVREHVGDHPQRHPHRSVGKTPKMLPESDYTGYSTTFASVSPLWGAFLYSVGGFSVLSSGNATPL